MKNWMDVIKNLTMLTQFGLSFITPIFLCLAACWWLNVHGDLERGSIFRDSFLDWEVLYGSL